MSRETKTPRFFLRRFHEAGLEAESDDAPAMPKLPANALRTLPKPPRKLPVATPPRDHDDALDDVARELALHVALVRCQREQRGGIMSTRVQTALSVDLPAGWIAPLACGMAMTVQGREWTAQMLAVHADLPLGVWRALRDAARAWRLERLRLAPADFPLAGLPALEDQVPPLAARLLDVLLVNQSGNDLNLVLARSGYGVCTDLEDWANCLGEERSERRRADLALLFGLDSDAVRLGLFEPPTVDELASSATAWEPRLCPALIANLLGEPLETLAREPGITVARPRERLADVVLSDEQRRLVAGIDTAWSTHAGSVNALAVLLHGPSGTGKTLLARALAGERGVPLVLLDGAQLERRRDRDEDGLAGSLTGLVRRTAAEHAILFIDEADDLLRDGTDASRAFLIALERHPAVVLLATNKPLTFDPALDRRLQIKIRMDIPGPSERAAILRLELDRSGIPLAPGLAADERLTRLAGSARLSGGHWRSVVQVAGMLAGSRGNAAGTPVTLEDLAEALRLQVADEQVVDRSRMTRVRWIDRPRPASAEAWGEARTQRFAALAEALDHLRVAPRPGRTGIGAVLAVHGPDTALATELGEALAAALHLPLARIGDWQLPNQRHASDEDDASSFTEDLFAARSGWAGPRGGGRKQQRQPAVERSERMRWSERDITTLLNDLGGCSVVQIGLADTDAVEDAMPLLEALALGPHVTVLHLREGSIPPELRRRAAAVLPWAVVDPAIRRLRWTALGGTGEPPPATALRSASPSRPRTNSRRNTLWSGTISFAEPEVMNCRTGLARASATTAGVSLAARRANRDPLKQESKTKRAWRDSMRSASVSIDRMSMALERKATASLLGSGASTGTT